jgi:transcriptional regulator with GAF, ATPase, and Fis domain
MPLITVRGPSGQAFSYRLEQDTLSIGRHESNALVLRDPTLSRFHAEIRRDGDGWLVVDRESRNGTQVNGAAVTGVTRIRPGDEVRLGDTTLFFGDAIGGRSAVDRVTDTTGVPVRRHPDDAAPMLVCNSDPMREILATVDKIAASSLTVLIRGESGTGKEMIARLIHCQSPRRHGPFVVVNCPALPGSLLEAELFGVARGVATGVDAREGRLECADGGTLLLDEIGDMDQPAQAKILRFLQEKAVERIGGREKVSLDVRLLAATNHDLERAMASGAFRGDLYHRLNVVTLTLPPLRERREDIAPLAQHFITRSERPDLRLADETAEVLESHAWPGNVRELEHVIERAVIVAAGPLIVPEDLPPAVLQGATASAETTQVKSVGGATSLFERIVRGGESFWECVHQPYLRRELAREDVRRLIEMAHAEAGSYKAVAELFRMPGDHKRLLDFLRNHGLGVRRPALRD